MKRFLAVCTGSAHAMEAWKARPQEERQAREVAGMRAWHAWAERNKAAIVEAGGPLGRTRKASAAGLCDIRNELAAYAVVQAATHDDAVALFKDHPHFSIFPGEAVEVMECLPRSAAAGVRRPAPHAPEAGGACGLREESPEDVDAIDAVHLQAFAGHPHSRQQEHRLVRALRQGGALALSLVALQEARVVGHVAFSPVTVDGRAVGWFGLGPVAVLPGLQGRGIGSSLVRVGLGSLQASGAAGCVVLGEPAYYRRFGFVADAGVVLPGVPPEYFQVLRWRGEIQGVVAYRPEFDAVA